MPLADDRRLAEVYHAGGESPAVIARRLDVREATVRRWLGLPAPAKTPPAPRVAADRYAAEPTTPRARRVWAAWQAEPGAGSTTIARRAGVSVGYASRLLGHWRAAQQEEARDATE